MSSKRIAVRLDERVIAQIDKLVHDINEKNGEMATVIGMRQSRSSVIQDAVDAFLKGVAQKDL